MSGSVVAAVPSMARELVQNPKLTAGSLTSVGKVLRTMQEAAKKCDVQSSPRLVAVTKTHSLEKVQWAYQQGLRHFGENYVRELHSKSNQLKLLGVEYNAVRWHYIGHLQRNKMKLLVDSPGLWMVESVSKHSTAKSLDNCWGLRDSCVPLKVMVQVNTSQEESKQGCTAEELPELVHYLLKECSHLELCGLMTIGRMRHSIQQGPNPDFTTLVQCRESVMSAFNFPRLLELSMGMSADFEHAIEMGSTSVRVGTALFGPRADGK